MVINNLPKPGKDFKATLGPGSFQRKLSSYVRYGDANNLRDNQKELVDMAKKYQGVIRKMGGLSRLQRRDAWLGIVKASKARGMPVTWHDKMDIKKVLEYLGRGAAAQEKKSRLEGKVVEGSGGKILTPEQVRNNLRRNMARDDLGIRARQLYETRYAGGQVQTKSIGAGLKPISGGIKTKGSMRDIGISRGLTGFAQGHNENKPINDSPPKPPPGGIKPIGL